MTATARQPGPPDLPFALAVALANRIAYPLDHLAAPTAIGALDGAAVRRAARVAEFRQPLNRAAADMLGIRDLSVAPEAVLHLGRDPAVTLAALLVTDEAPTVEAAARLVAAVVMQRRLVRLALKDERRRAAEVFGAAAFDVATREAPVLLKGLADLDPDPSGVLLGDPADGDGEARRRVRQIGFGALGGFARFIDAGLGRLFGLRFGEAAAAPPFRSDLAGPIVRLCRQGVPSWSALIG